MLGEREFEDKILHLGYYFNLLIYDATFLTHEYIADFFYFTIAAISYSHISFKPVFALSLDGAGKLPTGYAVIEGHPDLK